MNTQRSTIGIACFVSLPAAYYIGGSRPLWPDQRLPRIHRHRTPTSKRGASPGPPETR